MGLVELARQRVAGRPAASAEQLRKSRPLRNPLVQWTRLDDGSAALEAPLAEGSKGLMALIARWAKTPVTKKFELEPVGAFVWILCDGAHSFDGISRKLRDRYKMSRMEADAALSAFLQTLSQRRLISLRLGSDK